MRPPAGAFWIGSAHPFDLHECYLDFRAEFELPAGLGSAELFLTADSRYRLWINGRLVGRGPERSWPSAMAVDRRDVSSSVRAGRNTIVVEVYCPGYSHFSYVHRAACGLIGWLEVGGHVTLVSDASWQVRRDLSWSPRVPRVSIYGSGVEVRDLSRWSDPFAPDPQGWAPARVLQLPAGPIWAALRPRTTPLLRDEVLVLSEPWETRFGPATAGERGVQDDPHADLRQAFAACPKGPIPEEIPAGHTAIWVFDLGHSRACGGGAAITAAQGDRLTVSYAEKLRDGSVLLSDPATYCRMRPSDQTTLRAGRQDVEGFSLRGGRYLIFKLEASTTIRPDPIFHVRLSRYPLPQRASPDEDDLTLARVADTCQRTTLACLQDGFVDSVWRESSQWLGDVVAQSFALAALSDDPRPLRLAIDQAAAGAACDGILPSVVPGDVPAYVVTDYNFAWVELLDQWVRHPGRDDDGLLHRHWPVLCQMLDRFHADLGQDGLIRSQPGRRLFLDWSSMDRSEPNLTYNLRYLHALSLAMQLGSEAGLAMPETWANRATDLRDAILATFCDASGWAESPNGAPASQLALAFLILTKLVPEPEATFLANAIVDRSLDPDDGTVPGKLVLASPFMHHYVFKALYALGRWDDIRRIIALRWGRWANAGWPTTWENWSIDFPDGSACHGFSAHPLGWLALTRRQERYEKVKPD